MAHEARTIRVPEGSELALALEHADTTPVHLEKDGVVYRVSRETTHTIDTAAVDAMGNTSPGNWSDLDGEGVPAYIYRRDGEGGRFTPADPSSIASPADAEASREGIRNSIGSWKHLDVPAFKRYIAGRRKTSNRPSVRL
jgi:hypothetical protein